MEEEKCPIDNKCPIILECDKKNIIAELQAENKKQAERIEQLEEPLKAANFKVDGMLAVGQELINLKQRIKELETVLDKLARLGNEPNFGNSIGNQIAQKALPALSEAEGKEGE